MKTPTTTQYGFKKTVDLPYDVALEKVRAALKEQGFGILAEMDVRNAMKEKLGVDFPRYLILGACNPQLAYQALQTEPDLGLLLPCNVTVRASNDRTEVAVINAEQMLSVVGNDRLKPIAEQAGERLRKALSSI